MEERPLLDVVIVSYRCRALLRDCLSSLRQHAPRGSRMHVIDNTSDDGTAEMMRTEFAEVDFVVAERNLGFATANNVMIRRGEAPYVLVLNPDTRVPQGALDRLLELMEARPKIGMSGCRLELEDGAFDHASRRAFPTPLGALGHFSGLGGWPNAPSWLAQYRAPRIQRGPVDAINGAFMLLRRRALEEVGLFDEGYWMYMEDLDLCYRFAQAGWLTWYEPGVRVTHVKGGSGDRSRRPRINYAFHYGMYRFYRKHYAAKNAFPLNLTVYVGIGLKLATSVTASAIRRRLPRVVDE